jgi:hypothetical protein
MVAQHLEAAILNSKALEREIPDEHTGGVASSCSGLPGAFRSVDDVVMGSGRGVDELDRGGGR